MKDELPYIHAHYRRIGLEVTNTIIWEQDEATIKRLCPPMRYNSEIFDQKAHNIFPDTSRFSATLFLNDKNNFIAWCKENSFPIPGTETYLHGQIPNQTRKAPWYIKGAIAAAGQQIFTASTWQDVVTIAQQMPSDYQVQEALDDAAFLNVQYYAEDSGKVSHIATTEQRMDGFKHSGNFYPSHYDPRSVTDPAAIVAAQLGLRGVFAFDVAMTKTDIYMIECNPRYNGATFPTAIAARLGIQGEWSTSIAEVDTPQTVSLGDIDLKAIEFNPETGKGIVITVWGIGHMFGVMAIGTKAEQSMLFEEFRLRLKDAAPLVAALVATGRG